MHDYTPDMPPELPVEALREALGQNRLDAAQALLEAHDRAVRQVLTADAAALLDPRQIQAWMALASKQQALVDELATLRDQTAEQLRQLQRHQRSASAYLQAQE